jgi:ribonucleotide reductase alpha subunit
MIFYAQPIHSSYAQNVNKTLKLYLGRSLSMFDYAQIEGGNRIQIDRSRDENLTKFGIETLYDRYLLPEEAPQDLFARAFQWGNITWITYFMLPKRNKRLTR